MTLRERIRAWGEESAIEQSGARYAGFWRRFLSALIDMLIFLPFYFLLLRVLGEQLGNAIFTAIALLFFAWTFSCRWQATPGMRLTRVYIVDTRNRHIGFMHGLVWGITSLFAMIICFAAIFYLESKVNIDAVNHLLMDNLDILLRAQQGDVDPALSQLLGGFTYEQYQYYSNMALLVTGALLLIWSLAIALPRNKAGFHNWLCKTRFLVGRI